MAWLSSFFLALINAAASAFVTMLAADTATRWHRVSDFEGGRGMLIVFIFGPLGLIAGFIVGLIVARGKAGQGAKFWFQRLLKTLGVSALLIAAGLAFAWTTAVHPPTIAGKELDLYYEVRLPPGYPLRSAFEESELRIGVTASADDRHYSDIDFKSIKEVDGWIVVPGRAPLNSKSAHRSISVTFGPWNPENSITQFIDIPLAASPSHSDFAWSPWLGEAKLFNFSAVPEEFGFQVRYRVQTSK